MGATGERFSSIFGVGLLFIYKKVAREERIEKAAAARIVQAKTDEARGQNTRLTETL
jgi:hypothetical protein